MSSGNPRVLTNMAFWQSPLWRERTVSIYSPEPAEDPDSTSAWQVAWRLYRRRADFDVVLTMGVRESMAYGFLCALTGVVSKQVMTEVFIDEAQPAQWRWRLKTALYAQLAARAWGIITNSSVERETMAARYRLPLNHFIFVPLCATIPPEADPPEAEPAFVLSAGRTLRDFELMLQAAPAIDAPVVMIVGKDDLAGITPPAGVTLLREIDRAAYLDYLRRCTVVALPLKPTQRATGQVVMLEAMAMGKPVITTHSPGTIDTIRPGENGLLTPSGDASALVKGCRHLLADPAERRRLGHAARLDVQQHYSYDAHARGKWQALETFWQQQG